MHGQLMARRDSHRTQRAGSSRLYGREVPRHMLLRVASHVLQSPSYKAEWLHLL